MDRRPAAGTRPVGVEAPTSPSSWFTPYRTSALALCLVVLAWRWWSVSQWSWENDDWVYLVDTERLSWGSYVFQKYNGHLMPLAFALTRLMTVASPLGFGVAVAAASTASALSTWLWSRVGAELVGERLLLLAPLALFVLSPLLIGPVQWWASAVQVLPLQITTALVVLYAARSARSAPGRPVAWMLVWLVLGLAFWEKAVLLVLPATVVVLHRTPGPWSDRVRRNRAALAGLAAVTAVFLAVYGIFTRTQPDRGLFGIGLQAGHRSLGEAATFTWRGLGDLVAPGALGGPWGTLPTPATLVDRPPLLVTLLSAIVLAGILIASAARAMDAWLPLLLLASWVTISFGLIFFSARYDVLDLGSAIINEERYVVDTTTTLFLTLLLLWGRPRNGQHPVTPRTRRRAGLLVGALVTGSLVVGNTWGAATIGENPGRAWLRTLTSDVDREGSVALVDARPPDDVLQAAYWPDQAHLSRMLAPLPGVSFGGPAPQLWRVDGSGHLRPVSVGRVAEAPPGPDTGCGYALDPGEEVRLRLSRALYDWAWVVQVNGFTGEPVELRVTIGDTQTSLRVPAGLGQQQFTLAGAVPRTVLVEAVSGTTSYCLTDVFIGEPDG